MLQDHYFRIVKFFELVHIFFVILLLKA